MPDVLVSTDDVDVLGPPSIVDVLVDIGPTGTRGSQVFVGVGDPNVIEIGQTPIFLDLYINSAPGADYSYLYQYQNIPGGDLWVELLKINPTLYSKRFTETFVAGVKSLSIPIVDITSLSSLTAANFNVQYSISHTNAIASTVIPTISGTNLVLAFKASELASSTWQALASQVVIHLFISIVL